MNMHQFAWLVPTIACFVLLDMAMANDALDIDDPRYRHRAEFKQLYRDDLPYARYFHAMSEHIEQKWPDLPETGHGSRLSFEFLVYMPLVEALRDLTADKWQAEITQRQRAAHRIATAFERGRLGLDDLHAQFLREVFHEEWFQRSTSSYRDAVIDLWQRFERAGLDVPAVVLLGLNQPRMGRPGAQAFYTLDLRVGRLYSQLGEHRMAAQWYEKVPPIGLGPLKAADAYYLAGDLAEAERLYRHVLDNLDEWAEMRPHPRQAAHHPVYDLDPQATRKHVIERLAEIDQRQGN